MKNVFVAALMFAGASAIQCPGSPAMVHAKTTVDVVASTTCDKVANEMKARAKASSAHTWTDPHNNGTYALVSAQEGELQFTRVTGNGKYTDKIVFTLSTEGDSCHIEGCSESQVTSVADYSTNYCNQFNLYCGSDEKCKPVDNDFKTIEKKIDTSFGASSDKDSCLALAPKTEVQSTVMLESAAPVQLAQALGSPKAKCPGSKATIHASCEQFATISASCNEVQAEIQARVAGQSSGLWHDPHNNGTYSLVSSTDGDLELTRVTGNKKYTDKMTVTLSGSGDSCDLAGCSESQVFSIVDMSTNFCNVRMLYCGKDDGCKPVQSNFVSKVTSTDPSTGASADMKSCLKV